MPPFPSRERRHACASRPAVPARPASAAPLLRAPLLRAPLLRAPLLRAPLLRVVQLALAVVAVLVAPSRLLAQGALSTQGFGYPIGGLSTRAAATGGALAEFDHLSGRNPASVAGWGRSGLYFQYDPELRTLQSGDLTDRTTTARFGTLGAGFTLGERWTIGVSSHSFLDRSWSTSVRSGQRLGDDSVSFTERFSSRGGIGDKRLAVAYRLFQRLTVGGGVHLYSGENRLNLVREFDDSVRFGTLDRDVTLSYTGTGASAGFVFTPFRWISLAGSMRQGGTMRLRVVDTVRTEAKVPSRYGGAARLDVIPGITLLGSVDRSEWSRLNGLGSAQAAARDGWDYGVGAEFAGQRTRNASWVYSLGFRQRDLPFSANGAAVSERSLTGGLSMPLAGPRGTIDLALQRATREATGSTTGAATERAWLVSVGLSVRP